MFDSITKGLTEAIEFEQGKISSRRNVVKVTPPLEFDAAEIKDIRRKAGMTQVAFANILGVSPKTAGSLGARAQPPGQTSSSHDGLASRRRAFRGEARLRCDGINAITLHVAESSGAI